MKPVQTALNEKQHKEFQKKAENLGMTEYALLKDLALSCINEGKGKEWREIKKVLKDSLMEAIEILDNAP